MAAGAYQEFDSDFFNKYLTQDYYISRGASGNVYGPIPRRGLQLAIKKVTFSDGKVTNEFRKKLEDKKRIWTSLENEHLMKILSVELRELPKAMFIVMDYAAGGSLYTALRSLGTEKKLPIDVVTDWAKQIAEGMLHLHKTSIVHRDLKSSNILLMEPFDVCDIRVNIRIADFDDLKEHDHTTTMSALVGTGAYMAPEVLTTEKFSKASDVWSYGVVVWEMLSGDIPHKGLDQRALMIKSIAGKLENLPLQMQFPEDYKQLLSRCWEPASRERLSFHDIVRILQQMDI